MKKTTQLIMNLKFSKGLFPLLPTPIKMDPINTAETV